MPFLAPPATEPLAFDQGIFTLSLDFELIWGTLDKPPDEQLHELCRVERAEVLDGLLALLDEFGISATWCTVGHLFLDYCTSCEQSRRFTRPAERARDPRLRRDPHTDEIRDPAFYGRSLLDRILRCRTPQEIGCHTFTHAILDRDSCSRERAAEELEASVRAAGDLGLRMTSFAFPRNRIGHLDALAEHGFEIFRGQDAVWYERTEGTRKWRHRAAHLWDILTMAEPPAVMPRWHPQGLWEIPGSMLYTPTRGFRRYIPIGARVRRARKGLRAAARERRVFHLWFHPTDLAERPDAALDGIRQIFRTVSDLRAEGKMRVASMGALAGELGEPLPTGSARLHGARV